MGICERRSDGCACGADLGAYLLSSGGVLGGELHGAGGAALAAGELASFSPIEGIVGW